MACAGFNKYFRMISVTFRDQLQLPTHFRMIQTAATLLLIGNINKFSYAFKLDFKIILLLLDSLSLICYYRSPLVLSSRRIWMKANR